MSIDARCTSVHTFKDCIRNNTQYIRSINYMSNKTHRIKCMYF